MFKVKLELNGHNRWLTALHYEYFCPIDTNESYYKKFLYRNFPYESGDESELHPYHVRNIPAIKKTLLDKKLETQCREELQNMHFGSTLDFAFDHSSSFNEKNPLKKKYYQKLARIRHNAGLDRKIVPNYSGNYDKFIRPVEDLTARLSYNKIGGLFSMALESSDNDDPLYEWMLNGNMQNGRLTFYDGDGDQSFKIEFWDCYCIGLYEQMSSAGSAAMTMHLRISPAITRNRSVQHEKVWKVTDLSPKSLAFGPGPSTGVPVESGKVISCKFIDEKGKVVNNPKKNQNIILVINTIGMIGKRINIDLSDDKIDYEYQGTYVDNDLLKNILVTDDVIKLPLKTLKQRK